MNAVLAEMTAEEMIHAPWFVEVFRNSGRMSEREADEWRLRISAWQCFLEIEHGAPRPS